MPRDDRPFIRVHNGMPDHPKVTALSDAAFRLMVETWCWCDRNTTDGHVPAAVWRKRGSARARAELVAAGLVDTADAGVEMHDYLDHQRSAAEVVTAKAAAAEDGAKGAHVRWHKARGIIDPACAWCKPHRSGKPSGNPSPNPSGSPSGRHGVPDGVSMAEVEVEKEQLQQPHLPAPVADPYARDDEPGGQPGPAERLLAEHLAIVGKVNPRAMTELGGHIADLLRAAYTEGEIRAGFVLWRARGTRPSSLPDLVDVARRNGATATTAGVLAAAHRTPTTDRPSTTDARVGAGLDLAARYAAEGR
jgi:hypothetical protein